MQIAERNFLTVPYSAATAEASSPWKYCERMKIRDSVKVQNPDCKLVLVVDENAEKEVAKQVKQAKKDGLIDQFIYGSISASYLAAIMDSL